MSFCSVTTLATRLPKVVPAPPLPAVVFRPQLVGLEPNRAMFPYARGNALAADFAILPNDGTCSVDLGPGPTRSLRMVQGTAEALPFPDASFDAVVLTLVRMKPLAQGARFRRKRMGPFCAKKLRRSCHAIQPLPRHVCAMPCRCCAPWQTSARRWMRQPAA